MRSKDALRKRIIEENLLDYDVDVSDRNKEIVRKHVAGAGQAELAREYGLTTSRISAIVWNYINKCVGAQREWIEDILKEFVVKEGIRTTEHKIGVASWYMIDSGYGASISVATAALAADSKIREMLEGR